MAVMTTLARFPLGRMLLHLIAMVGDGCFRFHGAGMLRELRGPLDALTRFLADHLARPLPTPVADPTPSLAPVLHRGDVLLSDGNTRAAALVRRLTRSAWSHVSIYVGPLEDGPDPRCVIEADMAAGVRTIRLSELNALKVRVLRPQVSDADRSRLVEGVLGFVGAEYDHGLAWRLAASLLRRGAAPASFLPATARRFICCTLVAQAFALIGYRLPGIVPADFERIPLFDAVASLKL